MENREVSNQDHLKQWTEYGINQLYQFMESFQPTFHTSRSNDPILLAQELQETIDHTEDPHIRKIMGTAGEEMLQSVAPRQIAYRHLAISTNRLIILSNEDGELNIDDYTTNTLVTGLFERFVFEDADKEAHAERDWIAIKMTKPEFLFAKSKKIAVKLFDASKSLLPVSAHSELTIPVDAVKGQIYDPETLFR